MGFLIDGGESALEFVPCCEAMKRAARVMDRDESPCAPFVAMSWPPNLNGCDAAIEHDPIVFCPWCGKPVVRKRAVGRKEESAS